MHAAENGHVEIVVLLLEQGAEVNRADKYGSTALRLAEHRGRTGVVEILRASRTNGLGVF